MNRVELKLNPAITTPKESAIVIFGKAYVPFNSSRVSLTSPIVPWLSEIPLRPKFPAGLIQLSAHLGIRYWHGGRTGIGCDENPAGSMWLQNKGTTLSNGEIFHIEVGEHKGTILFKIDLRLLCVRQGWYGQYGQRANTSRIDISRSPKFQYPVPVQTGRFRKVGFVPPIQFPIKRFAIPPHPTALVSLRAVK